MKLIEYPDRDLMMIDLAHVIAGEVNAALHAHGRASLAVSGGTTPGPVFDALCAATLDWAQVTVLPTDERWVPEDHPRSNARLIRKRLLTDRAAAARFVSLYTGDPAPEDAEAALAETLKPCLPLSVVLLGMGGDMHTASLFPGAEGLAAALDPKAPPVKAIRGGAADEPRITLTLPVLEGAMVHHLVITGPEKRRALDRAKGLNDVREGPVAALLPTLTVHWAE